jgi:hypothetical protein
LSGGKITNALFGGSSGQQGGSGNASTYVPTGLGGADTSWQQIQQMLQGNLTGANQAINPALMESLTKMLGIDPSSLISAGNQAGQQYGQQAQSALGAQGQLGQNAANMTGAGNTLWNTAQDPQNQLRNTMQQQVTDASRAGTSARGIGMGGESAGIENKAVSDFLMNWQNQQLGRQATGLQGMGNAYNQAGRDVTGGLAAGALAPGYTQQAGAAPVQGQMSAYGLPMQAAGQFNQAQAGQNQGLGAFLSQIIPYLNSGQGATGQSFQQGQTGLNNLTTGLNQFNQNAPGAWAALSNLWSQPSAGSGNSPAYGGDNAYVPYGGGP